MSYITLLKALENHTYFNIKKCDGNICYGCKQPIPVVYIERSYHWGKHVGEFHMIVDRSNRVDVVTDGGLNLSYHINCWHDVIHNE